MQRQVPSLGRILTMVIFVLSCLGLLLFLWSSFGGPVPFKPRGYEFKVSFPSANLLTTEADVRIAGVTVGTVKNVALVNNEAQATVEMDEQYAPVSQDMRAIIRQKTLVGEAYVELTPGSKGGPKVPDGGSLATAQAAHNITFDEFLQTFDPSTRAAVRGWMQQMAVAVDGRGWDLNTAFGNLSPFTANFNSLLTILERDQQAVTLLVRNTSQTFGALTANGNDLRGLIENANTTFAATAASNQQLARAITLLPEFLKQSQLTLVRTRQFAIDTTPLVNDLKPVATNLKPVLDAAEQTAPDFKGLMEGLGPLIDASVDGVPGINKLIVALEPLSEQLYPFLLEVDPTIEWISQYYRETTAALGNLTSASQPVVDKTKKDSPHILRVMTPMNPESFAGYSSRLPSNRANAYPAPGAYDRLGNPGLNVFDSRTCSSDPLPTVGATTPTKLKELMDSLVFGLGSGTAPPCNQQPNSSFQGQSLSFPHVKADSNSLTGK